jgi:hypothetical protein
LTWTKGKFGSALHFPGGFKLDAFNASALKFDKQITIEVWLKLDKAGLGKQMGIIQEIDYPDEGFRVDLNPDGTINWRVEAGGKERVLTSKKRLADAWSYLAVTYDGNEMKIYINGSLDAATMETQGVLTPKDAHLYIGYFDQVHPVYLIGDINAIRISNLARKTFPMPDATLQDQ